MPLKPFSGVEPLEILAALQRDYHPEQIVSIMFRAAIPPARSIDEREQWLLLKGILACPRVYARVYGALGLTSLPVDPPATFHYSRGYSRGLETIGTLANMLMHGGVHASFVRSQGCSLPLTCCVAISSWHQSDSKLDQKTVSRCWVQGM